MSRSYAHPPRTLREHADLFDFTRFPLGAVTPRGLSVGACPACGRAGELPPGRAAPSGRTLPTLVIHLAQWHGHLLVTRDYCTITTPRTRAHLTGGPRAPHSMPLDWRERELRARLARNAVSEWESVERGRVGVPCGAGGGGAGD